MPGRRLHYNCGMIEAIITFSIRHRALVIGAGLALAVLGAFAAWETPVDAIPDLSENQVIVFTGWKGHGPREIEDQVTYPLSLGLSGLRGVRGAVIERRRLFDDQRHLRRGHRPVGRTPAACPIAWLACRPSFPTAPPGAAPDVPATGQIFWYTVEGGELDLGRLRAIQDWYVRPQIASVPGVAEVATVGGFPIEYQIAPDLNKLALHGLTIKDIASAVSGSNAAAAGHVIHKGNAEYVVRGVGWLGASNTPGDDSFDSPRPGRPGKRGRRAPDGGTVRLGEVAEIAIGPGFRRGVLEKDGNEVTGGVVLMANGENPLEVTRRIKAKVRELQTGLPRGSSHPVL